MTSNRDRILAYLRSHPEGADDDGLTQALSLKRRQQANQRCRELAAQGLVVRRRVNGKLRNYASGAPMPPSTARPRSDERGKAWYWEGNVQSRAAAYLLSQGYCIRRLADTAAHEQGIDLVAEKDGRTLWATAKGFPRATERTRPSTQAGHRFKDALFDIVEWRGQDAQADLAMARAAAAPAPPKVRACPYPKGGKARSSLNAVKHGIFARSVISPSLERYEDPAEFHELLAGRSCPCLPPPRRLARARRLRRAPAPPGALRPRPRPARQPAPLPAPARRLPLPDFAADLRLLRALALAAAELAPSLAGPSAQEEIDAFIDMVSRQIIEDPSLEADP